MHDEDDHATEVNRLCGWWICPDGTVAEGEEFGFHGEMAWRLLGDLFDAHGLVYGEMDLDACIEDAKRLGFARISTFHGSDAMHLDYDAARIPAPALRAAAGLVRDYRDRFSRYVFEFVEGEPAEFIGDHNAVRARLSKAARIAPKAAGCAEMAEVLSGKPMAPAPL